MHSSWLGRLFACVPHRPLAVSSRAPRCMQAQASRLLGHRLARTCAATCGAWRGRRPTGRLNSEKRSPGCIPWRSALTWSTLSGVMPNRAATDSNCHAAKERIVRVETGVEQAGLGCQIDLHTPCGRMCRCCPMLSEGGALKASKHADRYKIIATGAQGPKHGAMNDCFHTVSSHWG